MRTFSVMTAGFLCLLTACGGGGGSSGTNSTPTPQPAQTAEGRFIDAVVVGLSFTSGDQMGATDSEGTFTYEVGQNITFSVGAVEIGTVAGGDIISPVDLTGSNSTMPDTQNIVRFLLMLDSDGDSSNGITISNEVQLMAANWTQVDFTTDLLDGELATIISDVAAVDNRVPVCLKVHSAVRTMALSCYGYSMSALIRSYSGMIHHG